MAGSFDRSAILESFLKEINAYLPEMESLLDRAQRQPQDVEAMEEIYRRAHTIAGAAAMMDMAAMAVVATSVEAVASDALDGVTPLSEPIVGLIRRSVGRMRQVADTMRAGSDPAAIAQQDNADHLALRGSAGPAPTPRRLGGPGRSPGDSNPPSFSGRAASDSNPPSFSGRAAGDSNPPSFSGRAAGDSNPPSFSGRAAGDTNPPFSPAATPPTPSWRRAEEAPTGPVPITRPGDDALAAPAAPRLGDSPLWRATLAQEQVARVAAEEVIKSLDALRDVGKRFERERDDLLTFLNGSQDALDRLEAWAGQAMGIDLRTSPDHVRRFLPLSVLWVVTQRMKDTIERLHSSVHDATTSNDDMRDAMTGLRQSLERASAIAGGALEVATMTPNGGFTASVAQFSWSPPARDGALRPGQAAEMERATRADLRRELEAEVRAELAAELRRDEERKIRQELEIQLRRQLLAELSPSLGAENGALGDIGALAGLRREAARPRRVVAATDRSSEALEVFRSEAEEHLRTISDGLDKLERDSGDSAAIQSIRRAVHTLKGAAAITGFATVADLAHICEDVLDRMSEGSIIPTPDVISLILDTSQALEALVSGDTAEQGGEIGLLAALRPRYEALLGDAVSLGAAPATVPAAARQIVDGADHADDDLDRESAAPQDATAVTDLSVRLPLRKLDDLIALFGDLLVNRGVVEERLSRVARLISESGTVGERLREVGTQIDRQFEAALLPSRRALPPSPSGQPLPPGSNPYTPRALPPAFGGVVSGPNATTPPEFDPLEMDRYSEFHRLSRGLSEGVADAAGLNNELEAALREMELALSREARLSSQFQDSLLKVRLVPISSIVPRLYRAIQSIAIKYGKEFEFSVEGEDTEVDRGIYEDLAGPLLHLVRNAIYHGIETPATREASGKTPRGRIVISARYEGNQIVLSIRDDGDGLNPATIRAVALARGLIDPMTALTEREIVNLIFQPGFSTSSAVTEEGGRGVGLDVVRDTVTRLRGTVEVDSTPGQGTTFSLKLPISLQIQRVVLVRAQDHVYAVPMAMVEQLVQLDVYPRARGDIPGLEVRGEIYPLAHLSSYLHLAPQPINDKTPILLLNTGHQRWGLMVDAIVGRQEIVAKTLGAHLKQVPSISGATVLGNGQVMLILDPIDLLARGPRAGDRAPLIPPPGTAPQTNGRVPSVLPPTRGAGRGDGLADARPARPITPLDPRSVPYILVVDDSPSVRRVVSATLRSVGWDVMTARDGQEALEVVAKRVPVGVLLDIEMPRMDGYALMEALRGQPALSHLPLIVLTSRAATKHQQRALQVGADAYVVKPYQDEQLLATIHELIPVKPNGEPR